MNGSINLETPRRALAIGAHPDDIEFGAGGTLARWATHGCEVTMVVVTDGSKGTWDRTLEPQQLAAIRLDEQSAAARRLGANPAVHLGHADGELVYSMRLRAEVCRQIRMAKPDVVLGHDPWKPYTLHPDHRAAGLAVVDGAVAARDHLFFPEQGLPSHRPSSLLLWSAAEPDHWEDITDTIDIKIDALLDHHSQAVTTMGGDGAEDRAAFRDEVRRHAAEAAGQHGPTYAEAFKRITL